MSNYRVTLTNTTQGTLVLTKDLLNWKEFELHLKRSDKWHGIFFEFSEDVQFWCNGGGKEFVDAVYEDEGAEGEILIQIDYKCNDFETNQFEDLFGGKLNLNNYKRDRETTTTNIERNDFSKLIDTRGDTKVDLASTTTIDGSAMSAYTYANYDINLHSRVIFVESEIAISASTLYLRENTFTISQSRNGFMQNPLPLLKNDLKSTFANGTLSEWISGGVEDSTMTHFHFADFTSFIDYPATIDVAWDFQGTYRDKLASADSRGPGSNITLVLRYGESLDNSSAITLGTLTSYTTSAATYTQTINETGTNTITLDAGDKCWLYWFSPQYTVTTGAPASTHDVDFEFDYTTAELNLSIDSSKAASTGKGFAMFEAWSRICESITDQTSVAFDSEFYGRKNSSPTSYAGNGCGSFTALMGGLAVRGFNLTDRPTYASLNDMFKTCNTVHNIGLGIDTVGNDTVIKVEEKAYFYSDTVVLTLDNVENIEIESDTSLIWNELKIGYKKWKPKDVQGLDEFNTIQERTTALKNTENKLDLTSPYVASGLALEITRRKSSAEDPTKDTEYDDNNFIIALSTSVDGSSNPDELDTPEKDENYTTVSNVQNADTAYNLRFSPSRCFLRHLNILSAGLAKNAGSEWMFTSAEGNREISTDMIADSCNGDYSGAVFDEDKDVAWDDANARLNEPIYVPEIHRIEHPITHTQYKALQATPEGIVQYSLSTLNYVQCYIKGVSYNNDTHMAKFTLIKKYTG